VTVGVGGDEDAARGRRPLDPAGPVDRLAHHDEVLTGTVVERAHHHDSSVDTDPHRQFDAVPRCELAVEVVE
jgi:hypothetical protein